MAGRKYVMKAKAIDKENQYHESWKTAQSWNLFSMKREKFSLIWYLFSFSVGYYSLVNLK